MARLGTGSADPRGYDEDLVRALRALRRAVEGRWFHTGAGRHWFSWLPDRLTQ